MDSRNYENMKVVDAEQSHQYNHQHFVFVTKYRNRIFQYQEVIDAVRMGIRECANGLVLK